MDDGEPSTTQQSGQTCPMNLEEVKVIDIDNPDEVLVKGQGIGNDNVAVTKETDISENPTVQNVTEESSKDNIGEHAKDNESTENSNDSNSISENAMKTVKSDETVDEEGKKSENTAVSDANSKIKRLSKIDFSVFEDGFYRRYKSFFHDKLADEIDLSQDKAVVSQKINEHFSNFEINPVDVIRTFLVLRKNSEHSHGHFVMSPAQSPEPNINQSSEGNTRGRRCANKDIVNNDANNSEANTNGVNSYKGEYKSENSSIVENHTEIGVSTRNSKKGRVSNRGRR
ncbi:hypothetical protein OJ253_1634 [Cryptosporidium canis]|uniref:Histone deacetylase complex subunit SAP30 Sin3 binding domain-containing protein n=1 Tax=Cryptosporidium canis TaxID=195482 RepID=A0A9D5DM33_9CRYT|nr:hypothetical protein OJ253_1634 [Cryptosporidium canis]